MACEPYSYCDERKGLLHDIVLVERDEVILAGIVVGTDDRGYEINTFRIIGEHVIILLVDADEIDYHDAGLSILGIIIPGMPKRPAT